MDINSLLQFDPSSTTKQSNGVLAMENYPQSMSETPQDFVTRLTTADFNYDYSSHNTKDPNYDSKSFWEELSEPVKEAGEFVWDSAKGTWTSVKESVVSTGKDLYNVVDSAGTKLAETTTSIFDGLLTRIVIIFAVIVIGLVMLGRSGVLKDIIGGIMIAKS